MRCLRSMAIMDWVENGDRRRRIKGANKTVGQGEEIWVEMVWTCRKSGEKRMVKRIYGAEVIGR